MNHKKALASALCAFLVAACGWNPFDSSDGPEPIFFEGMTLQPESLSGGRVTFRFALADKNGQRVNITRSRLENLSAPAVRLYEKKDGAGAWKELDYPSASYLAVKDPEFSLDIALVLDYSNAAAQVENGLNTITASAQKIISSLGPHQKVTLVEFHGDLEPAVLWPLSADHEEALSALNLFAGSGVVSGDGRVWDAVSQGVHQLGRGSGCVKALVVVTNGAKGTSALSMDDVLTQTAAQEVLVFPLGFGNITSARKKNLTDLAEAAGTRYYQAADADALESLFDRLWEKLEGMYTVSYISAQKTGMIDVKLEAEHGGSRVSQETAVNMEVLAGRAGLGLITADTVQVSPVGTAEIVLYAQYMPEGVERMEITLQTDLPIELDLSPGPLYYWTQSSSRSGFFKISGEGALPAGSFGPLIAITVKDVPKGGMAIPLTLSIDTTGGRQLEYPGMLVIRPRNFSAFAGIDIGVRPGGIFSLSGQAFSDLSVREYAWKCGDGSWQKAPGGKQDVTAPAAEQQFVCSLSVEFSNGEKVYDDIIAFVENPYFSKYMVRLPAAGETFRMGGGGESDEKPAHEVTFTADIWIDTAEATQARYKEIMGWIYGGSAYDSLWDTGSGLGGNYPAYGMNWFDAVLYCNAWSRRNGLDTVYSYTSITGTPGMGCVLGGISIDYTMRGYRLPTEAEWEFACRAGTSTAFYWGDSISANHAWTWEAESVSAQPGALKLPNAFGLYDMSGNLWEWCGDWYGSYSSKAVQDPIGPVQGGSRVVRGGAWFTSGDYVRSRNRWNSDPRFPDSGIGFRMVIAAE